MNSGLGSLFDFYLRVSLIRSPGHATFLFQHFIIFQSLLFNDSGIQIKIS